MALVLLTLDFRTMHFFECLRDATDRSAAKCAYLWAQILAHICVSRVSGLFSKDLLLG